MPKRIIFAFWGTFACAAWLWSAVCALALDEEVAAKVILSSINDGRRCAESDAPFWTRNSVANPEDGYLVRFSRFGCDTGERGAIVVAPGRGEASVEYYETAIDFVALGYGPVYVVDHRGQGFSPRLLPDPDKAHVDAFSDYVVDFAAVVEVVKKDIHALDAPRTLPLWFMSNSMGGAIGLGYFQSIGEDNPFAGAALAGPMIRVNYFSFVERQRTWINLRIYSEVGALLQASWRCLVASLWNPERCNEYASPNTFGPYDPAKRVFRPDSESAMTHSKTRFGLRSALWDEIDWPKLTANEYEPDELWKGPQIGGATNRWVQSTALYNRQMRRWSNLKKMQTMPIMIMMGTRDLRGYRPYPVSADRPPDLGHAKGLCDDLNEISARQGGYICEFVAIDGGFHELFKESDQFREKAIATINWFFQRQ